MKRNGANLTEGKPVKLILQFAIPVFLGNLFQLFYGLIDTKIVVRERLRQSVPSRSFIIC